MANIFGRIARAVSNFFGNSTSPKDKDEGPSAPVPSTPDPTITLKKRYTPPTDDEVLRATDDEIHRQIEEAERNITYADSMQFEGRLLSAGTQLVSAVVGAANAIGGFFVDAITGPKVGELNADIERTTTTSRDAQQFIDFANYILDERKKPGIHGGWNGNPAVMPATRV